MTALATSAATLLGVLALGTAPASAWGGELGGTGADYSFQDSPGGGATQLRYGRPWDRAILGDWDGDGIDTLAVRRGNVYHVTNAFTGGDADVTFAYGRPDDTVFVGDWDGDGVDTLAVRRGNRYFLKNGLGDGNADVVLDYGRVMDVTVVGDWDGDRVDTLGVRRGRDFHLANTFAGGTADSAIEIGGTADIPYSGDWDGDGRDDVGIRDGVDATMKTATQRGARSEFSYGTIRQRLLVGDWNGDGVDSFGLRTSNAADLGRPPATASTADIVLQKGREAIGLPYVWGGNGPSSYDCSGLTRHAYGAVGIWLPRLSADQPSRGVRVSPEQALPGDLIWWPGHVSIYAGNGMMVDAASEALGVLERPVPPSPTFYRMF